MLLLTFPELKCKAGPVAERLHAANADPAVFTVWQELVVQDIRLPDEDDEF